MINAIFFLFGNSIQNGKPVNLDNQPCVYVDVARALFFRVNLKYCFHKLHFFKWA